MRIAICEDEEREKEQLRSDIEAEFVRRRLSVEILTYKSGEILLQAAKTLPIQIYFLDIYMSGISGVTVAKTLRAQGNDATIVFTTSSREYFAEGFAVGAVHYLVKPYAQEDIQEAVNRCLRQVNDMERYIELIINRKNCRILLSELRWAESNDKVCYLHLRSGVEYSYLRLDELEQKLDNPCFLRCHRSFLINMDYVAGIENRFFIMDDGLSVPMRQPERARLRCVYEDYLFDKMRRGH